MKCFKIVLLLIVCCFALVHVPAQVRTGKDQPHVLYAGIENNLDYLLNRYDTLITDFKVSDTAILDFRPSSGELVYYYKYNQLTWKSCERTEDVVTILVYNKIKRKRIDEVELKVTPLPEPSIVVPSQKHLLLWGKKELYENNVIAAFSAPHFKFKCEIVSFDIELQKQTAPLKEYSNNGAKYTEAAIGLMKQFEKGDTAYFTNFEVKCGCREESHTLPEKLKFIRVGGIIKVDRLRID